MVLNMRLKKYKKIQLRYNKYSKFFILINNNNNILIFNLTL